MPKVEAVFVTPRTNTSTESNSEVKRRHLHEDRTKRRKNVVVILAWHRQTAIRMRDDIVVYGMCQFQENEEVDHCELSQWMITSRKILQKGFKNFEEAESA